MTFTRRMRRMSGGQRGMTLLELVIAGAVLTIGMVGLAALISTSIAANARSRGDSSAVMLSQAVMEQISSTVVGQSITSMKDCSGAAAYSINTAVGGAQTTNSDDIDWTETSPASGYHMDFTVCASATQDTSNAQQKVYDVRWNVQSVNGTNTYLVVVSARPKNWKADLKNFSLPLTLKNYVGPDDKANGS